MYFKLFLKNEDETTENEVNKDEANRCVHISELLRLLEIYAWKSMVTELHKSESLPDVLSKHPLCTSFKV